MAILDTITQAAWPATPEFLRLSTEWTTRFSNQFIQLLWRGLHLMDDQVLSHVDFNQEPAQLERSLGYLLHNRIRLVMDRALPFDVVHEPYDFELLMTRRARPPQPDLGFTMLGDDMTCIDRVIWPVEMKVLADEADVSAYAKEVRANLLTSRYASLTGEGAMLGYLRSGDPAVAFDNISKALPAELRPGADNPPNHHMVSDHQREVPDGATYSHSIRCHHLLFLVLFGASRS